MRHFSSLLCIAALSSGLLACVPGNDNLRRAKPNVILILSDDQGWGDLQSHGNPYLATPVLDRLAEEGARLEQFYVSPLCAPTRASLLTGRYERRTGTSWVSKGLENLNPEEVTLAELFQQRGYATACFGKWHNGSHWPYHPNRQGFGRFIGFCGGHWSNYFDTELEFNGEPHPTTGYITDVLTDAAIRFIQESDDQPYFCYLAYNVPHSPFQVPDGWYDRYASAGLEAVDACVYAMVENMDWNIGRLLSALDSSGQAENTIVIFLSDNGPNGNRYNGGMRGIKGSIDEGGVRVPFIIRWPGAIRAGLRIPDPAAHIDLLPTLASFCALEHPAPAGLDGISLDSLLRVPGAQLPERFIFTHRSLETPGEAGAVRGRQYRLVLNGIDTLLYDMTEDPGQNRNVANYHRDIVRSMAGAYAVWHAGIVRDYRPATEIRIGFPDQVRAELPAHEAAFGGGIRYMEGHGWAHDWLTMWRSRDDSISWQVQVEQAGRYRLEMLYTCPAGQEGSVIRATTGGQELEAVLKEPFDPPFLPSPDRVQRIEVYEKPWARLELGAMNLEAGPAAIVLKAREVPGLTVADVKGLRIIRAD
jgi:arylsulfatase A-like enzyme